MFDDLSLQGNYVDMVRVKDKVSGMVKSVRYGQHEQIKSAFTFPNVSTFRSDLIKSLPHQKKKI